MTTAETKPEDGPPVHKEFSLNSWGEYRNVVAEIVGKYGHHEKWGTKQHQNIIAFRGQQSSKWRLETTLERSASRTFTLRQYFDRASRYLTEISSLTDTTWDLPREEAFEEGLRKYKDMLWVYPPAYPYLVYLRHHGFPSPLLDWSLSPYVAAFFAFQDVSVKSKDSVAVYVFIETPNGTKSGAIGGPGITLLGRNVPTHKRHFMQQAIYTWCVQQEDDPLDYVIRSHHDVLKSGRHTQDVLLRITIPSSEKGIALRDLMAHNITPYTLFGTEDALIKTMELRAFILD